MTSIAVTHGLAASTSKGLLRLSEPDASSSMVAARTAQLKEALRQRQEIGVADPPLAQRLAIAPERLSRLSIVKD